VLNALYGADVSDAHSGFRVITAEALERLDLRSDGMEFASEMLMRASAAGLDVREAPITYHERVGDATLESLSDGWRHVRFMLTNAPDGLFWVPGAALAALGVVVMALAAGSVRPFGLRVGVHSLVAGCLLTIVGVQTASLASLTAIGGEPIRAPTNPLARLVRRRFTLERGLAVGALLIAAGAAYALVALWRWVASGFEALPFLATDILALTAVVVGIQAITGSFMARILADDG
jgi:hypothetical protein